MGNIIEIIQKYVGDENKKNKIENLELKKKIDLLENKIKLLEKQENIKYKLSEEKRDACREEEIQQEREHLKESVIKIVDNMLENDGINSVLLPDYIEKKLYINVLTMIINLLKETLENTNLTLLNQKISLKVEPNK